MRSRFLFLIRVPKNDNLKSLYGEINAVASAPEIEFKLSFGMGLGRLYVFEITPAADPKFDNLENTHIPVDSLNHSDNDPARLSSAKISFSIN